tara:strand:+ start:369 stop:545 length:177 start_codon:yes stop_codon:yes gene_type:complete
VVPLVVVANAKKHCVKEEGRNLMYRMSTPVTKEEERHPRMSKISPVPYVTKVFLSTAV